MSSRACTHCGCNEIDTDPARGDAVCTGCGSVLEDQIIVSEVQFQENAAGGASVIGQYVSAEGPKGHSMGAGFHHGLGKESRAITLQNGKKRLQHLGNQLRLNQHCVDTAFNFFKMAVIRRLTRGRRTHHVTAACLYIVCRTEGTAHMLLDFADILQTGVYVLGRTYLQLSKELCINIPALDPCIYIQRFAHKLEFGDKTHEVSMAALRLVSRMKRDWMAQGRRPSGLCGAALLVAARIHDFNRTIKDIVRVVQIGEGTIRKRLAEFEATPSSDLTIDEFQKIDLEEEMDPPCFTEGRRKAKLQQLEEQGQLPSLTLEIVELQDEIEKTLDEIIAKKAKRFSGIYGTDTSSVCSSAPSLSELDSELAQLEQDQATKFITEETVSTVLDIASKRSHEDGENRTLESDDETDSVKQSNEVNDKDTLLMPPPTFPIGRPTAASLGLRESIEEHMKIRKPDEPEEEVDESGELDLTGIDDEELDLYILTEREAKLKTKIWMEINADYLKEMKEKEEREAKLKEEQKDKPEKKRKKPRKKQQTKEASTAREAIEKMLQEKKISSKINYDVLRSLTSDLKKVETTTTSSPTLGSGSIEALPTTLPTTPQKRFRRLSSSQGPTMKSESKSERKIDLSEPAEKKSRLEPDIREEVVVVESGPIEYAAEEADDIDEEEEEEEEEEHVSAAQLMGHNTAEDDYDGGDMGYEDYD